MSRPCPSLCSPRGAQPWALRAGAPPGGTQSCRDLERVASGEARAMTSSGPQTGEGASPQGWCRSEGCPEGTCNF